MAKRKTTTKTAHATRPDLGALVGTQRAALESFGNKHDLAELAVKLAGQFGTPEQRARSAAEVEAEKRETIEALVADLALKAQAGKKVHLSELGGWPACWPDERRDHDGEVIQPQRRHLGKLRVRVRHACSSHVGRRRARGERDSARRRDEGCAGRCVRSARFRIGCASPATLVKRLALERGLLGSARAMRLN